MQEHFSIDIQSTVAMDNLKACIVVFHWLQDKQCYKQFISNRVKKTIEKSFIRWRHVPSQGNPSDLERRRYLGRSLIELWRDGPNWQKDPAAQSRKVETYTTEDSDAEKKAARRYSKLQ